MLLAVLSLACVESLLSEASDCATFSSLGALSLKFIQSILKLLSVLSLMV
jgi:hypothetical protein